MLVPVPVWRRRRLSNTTPVRLDQWKRRKNDFCLLSHRRPRRRSDLLFLTGSNRHIHPHNLSHNHNYSHNHNLNNYLNHNLNRSQISS